LSYSAGMREQAIGLRERRQALTSLEIHLAALDLFEELGVRATTVQLIAERAGVSMRTFFRYYSTKEQAGLPGQRRLIDAIEAFRLAGDEPAFAQVDRMFETVLGDAEDAVSADRGRVGRLLAMDPEFAAYAVAQDHGIARRLAEKLPDPLIAELAVLAGREAWSDWAAHREGTPAQAYRAVRARMRALLG
jgi:AcrR family transcriptional regulator